ncbi:MAG: hypothetical protein M0R80_23485 [Proteobacteria bacterium]|jgi:hypothetical protein|nr:hypothetical protein [Pseudomonadota bacterium]
MRAHRIVLGLALIALPRLATAAVVVAEPTGDADAAFLTELKASLEAVAAEVAPDVDAELRSSAAFTDAGAELVVELVLNDGSDLIRETRTASRASALSQARAMARAAIKTFVDSSSAATGPRVQTPVAAETTVSRPEEVEPPPEPPKPPPLPEKYSRRKAMQLSLWPTVILVTAGGGLSMLFMVEETFGFPGLGIGALGLVLGPSVGYLWLGRASHAMGMAGLRLAAVGTGIAFMAAYVSTFSWGDDCTSENGTQVCETEGRSHPGFLVVSIIGITAAVVGAFVDAALVGRAADRANAEWREKNKPQIQVAPMAWSNGNGDRSYGLAVSGSF